MYNIISMTEQRKGLFELLLAIIIGVLGYGICKLTSSHLTDPLVLSLLGGIIVRALLPEPQTKGSINSITRVLIPVGLVFYSAHFLNFARFAEVRVNMMLLLLLVVAAYFISIIIAGRLLKQRDRTTYLIANGSAICGASAIVITSPAVDAEPDDVSISVLSVFITALTGLFIILPFIATTSGITDRTYGILSGMILQFTGIVKVAVTNIPYLDKAMPKPELLSFALSIKAVRFLGLLLSIPIFSSIMKGRIHIPYVLWLFLLSGIAGTWIYTLNKPFYSNIMIPVIHPLHEVSWSIVMASIGLNADIRRLLSDNGVKALVMAFIGFISATAIFFIGFYLLRVLRLY